jgi:hypothetical protein
MSNNFDQVQNTPGLEKTNQRTGRKRARRWDAILVGIVFSVAFILLVTKVAQTTPCEIIDYFGIEARSCQIVNNVNTMEGQLVSQHGPGFEIVIQYGLLTLELFQSIVENMQQFIQNVALTNN